MQFRQLDLNLLVALDALLTERNITEAGRRVFLTQSAMSGALDTLRREHELVLIEGAGSPAEINLPDLVNNRIVDYADAAALLIVAFRSCRTYGRPVSPSPRPHTSPARPATVPSSSTCPQN